MATLLWSVVFKLSYPTHCSLLLVLPVVVICWQKDCCKDVCCSLKVYLK